MPTTATVTMNSTLRHRLRRGLTMTKHGLSGHTPFNSSTGWKPTAS